MGIFNQEQLEGLISQIKEVIANAEMLLSKNPNLENADDVKSLIKSQKKSLAEYQGQLNELNEVGRPAIGVTKKVSLTLPETYWDWLDEKADGNRSKFLREVVGKALGNESEWSNYACLGYAIAGAKKLGYDDEKIGELVRSIYGEFDWVSVPEAEKVYTKSDY